MLQNLPIRAKLAVILIIPLLALAILAYLRIAANLSVSQQADQTAELTAFSLSGTELIHELQNERGLSVRYLGVEGRTVGNALQQQWEATGQALAAFQRSADSLDRDSLEAAAASELDAARSQVGGITNLRQQVQQAQNVTIPGVVGVYNAIIADLVNTNREIAEGIVNRDLARETTAFVALSRVKELKTLEREQVTEMFAQRRGDAAEYAELHSRYTSTLATEAVLLAEFRSAASAEQQAAYVNTVVGPEAQRVKELQSIAVASADPADLTIEPVEWWNVSTFELGLIREVEQDLGGDAVALSNEIESAARSQTLIDTAVIVLVLLFSFTLSLIVARSMVRPLGVLRVTAEAVARIRLPGVVERLQRAEQVEFPAEAAPIRVASGDEIGKVAEAFNSVHSVAVRVAAEQAALRRSVGDMFMSIGKRIQGLVARQLELLDELEREEVNPAQLNSLFRLDHLATRMRRNAENLLVLSGSEPVRRWSESVALSGILRAAAAEIEDYTRVVIRPSGDAQVAGQAVNDLVHLLAELLENATNFSAPGTTVHVAGDPTQHGFVIEIEDQGAGMSEEEMLEANERLANPPRIDFTVAQRLGFFVVGRLAARHGIRVRLRSSWYGGVTALVVIPPSLISDAVATEPEEQLPVEAPRESTGPIELSQPAARPPVHTNGQMINGDNDISAPRPPLMPHQPSRADRQPAVPTPEFANPATEFARTTGEFGRATGEFGRATGEFIPATGAPPHGDQNHADQNHRESHENQWGMQPPAAPPAAPPAPPPAGRLPRRAPGQRLNAADGPAAPLQPGTQRPGRHPQLPTGPLSSPSGADSPAAKPGVFQQSGSQPGGDPGRAPRGAGRLPRRVPMSRLAPGLTDETFPPADDSSIAHDDPNAVPDRVRTILSAFRSGTERGRRDAQEQIGEAGAPPPPHGSDDDQTA